MPAVKPLGKGIYSEQIGYVRDTIKGKVICAGLDSGSLDRKKVMSKSTYCKRLREDPGKFSLQELWKLQAAGVMFTDEEILSMCRPMRKGR